jgi:adenosylcobinamide kinase/adenosylcobinamide-phosphate guanylyltransferase
MTSWLFTGGARSGKSTAAEELAAGAANKEIVYLATAVSAANDAEWQQRISLHQSRRPSTWRTVETLDVTGQLALASSEQFILVDCLTLWLSGKFDEVDIWQLSGASAALDTALTVLHGEMDALIDAIKNCYAEVALVTNEVGSGIVPFESATRLFRDELGILNMKAAAACDHVRLCVAGLQLTLK